MIETPYFICDEKELIRNLGIVDYVKQKTGCKILFATKCFALEPLLKKIFKNVDGVVCSAEYEAIHARALFKKKKKYIVTYSPAFSNQDFGGILQQSTHIVFNSMSQLKKYRKDIKNQGLDCGLRLNPEVSGMYCSEEYGGLADPCRKFSRLGVKKKYLEKEELKKVDGVMFHIHCENNDFRLFSSVLEKSKSKFDDILKLPNIKWVSLGGGISFTNKDYPVDRFCDSINCFQAFYNVRVILEPGCAIVGSPFSLVSTVVDIAINEKKIAVLDTSSDAHMPDFLSYYGNAEIKGAMSKGDAGYENEKGYEYAVGGLTCLAGDVFGTYKFKKPLKIGEKVVFLKVGDYSMVKNSFFNGIKKPNIYLKSKGKNILIRKYGYSDYLNSIS
tara:strand:- start:6276 stop:7436 length:1161 start_codon:yes stop_codon:yes gene_type:complete